MVQNLHLTGGSGGIVSYYSYMLLHMDDILCLHYILLCFCIIWYILIVFEIFIYNLFINYVKLGEMLTYDNDIVIKIAFCQTPMTNSLIKPFNT